MVHLVCWEWIRDGIRVYSRYSPIKLFYAVRFVVLLLIFGIWKKIYKDLRRYHENASLLLDSRLYTEYSYFNL